MPAEATIDAFTLGQAAAAMASGPELPAGTSGEPPSDGVRPLDGYDDDDADDETGDEAMRCSIPQPASSPRAPGGGRSMTRSSAWRATTDRPP